MADPGSNPSQTEAQVDPDQQEIDALKASDDFQGLGNKVQSLFKLPQMLCKTRGNCCRIATFKGLLPYEKIQALGQSEDGDAANAREFLTLFIPYDTTEEVKRLAPVFVERVLAESEDPNKEVGFFKCRFVAEDGKCMIHEDRPTGCRVYPFPHEKTIYHPGCGFEQKGVEHWKKIQDITEFFEKRLNELNSAMSDEPKSES
jgi:Fe-S-cluster containining protein